MPTFPITIVFEIDAETEEEAQAILAEMLSPVFPVEAILSEAEDAESAEEDRHEGAAQPGLDMPGPEPATKDTVNRGRRKK